MARKQLKRYLECPPMSDLIFWRPRGQQEAPRRIRPKTEEPDRHLMRRSVRQAARLRRDPRRRIAAPTSRKDPEPGTQYPRERITETQPPEQIEALAGKTDETILGNTSSEEHPANVSKVAARDLRTV